MKVPGLSIVFISISAAVAIFLPLFLFIRFKAKYKVNYIPALLGAGIFILFALILRPLFLSIFQLEFLIGIFPTPVFNLIIYISIVCLASGLFEETGRFIAFKWILKRDSEKVKTPLSYGIGHGGIEAILLVGFSMISLLITSMMINNGQIMNRGLTDDQAVELIDFIQTDSFLFLAAGIERILAVALHICLSVLVWLAITRKQYLLYPAAILLHALTNVSAALYQLDIIVNLWIVEGILSLCVLITAVLTWLAYAKLPNRASVPDKIESEH
jgi:uncharacterized membrane protein YhfC